MATSSNSSTTNAGGSIQTGTGGSGSITGGGSASVDFGSNNGGGSQQSSSGGEQSYNGNWGGNASYDYSAANAAAAARAEAERKAAEDRAKRQADDRKRAADTQQAQRERRSQSASSIQQEKRTEQEPAEMQQRNRSASQPRRASTMRTQAVSNEDVARNEGASQDKQAHVRRAPNGQLYDSESAEIIEDMAANNLAGSNVEPTASQAPRGTMILSAGQRTPGRPGRPSNLAANAVPSTGQARRPAAAVATQGQQQGQTIRAAASSAPGSSARPSQIAQDMLTDRQRADRVFYRQARQIQENAQEQNENVEKNLENWVNEHRWATQEMADDIRPLLTSEEDFAREAEPLMKSHYRTLDEYEEGREATNIGRERPDTRRTDRMIDQLVKDLKLGFFHITTERVVKDKATGKETVRWSVPVEDSMSNVMEYFGLHGIEGQQTVFRLVRMYASMGVDSNGNMFNEGKDEWTMNEREFCKICDFIVRSCIEHGHPMAMPSRRWQLRGTDIYPSGVMPKAVAKAITGLNSNLRMSPADLVQMCQNEWNMRTYPSMKANLSSGGKTEKRKNKETGKVEEVVTERNEIAQRIAIERMQQAISRLDGVSTEDFSRRYGVDTTLHFKLSEYEDQLAQYVTAANGNYDADKVAEVQQRRVDAWRREAMKQKGVKFHADEITEEIVIDGVKHRSYVQAGANLVTSIAQTNSVISRPVLAIASLAEKAVGSLRTKIGIDILTRIQNRYGRNYSVDDRYYERMRSEDAIKAMDAGKMLFEIGGPGAARLFKAEGLPCTQENVIKFLQDKYLRDTSHEGLVGTIDDARKKVQQWSQKLMVGDLAFKKTDTINWFNALLLANASIGNLQSEMEENGIVDTSGSMSLTGDEIMDIMDAHPDIAGFFTEMLGTDAGITAFSMMRANSIAQVNPLSYYTDRFLRDHGVTNMMITMFVDTFPKYGLNFLYNIMPFSRTLTYLAVKKRETSGSKNADINADLTIGGNISDVTDMSFGEALDDPNFQAGLRMNLVFDAMTLGHNILIGGVLGFAFLALGFEPPDDDENIYNVSMWKIGGKEIQWAWWLNDLTLLGMPFAYYIASGVRTGDWQLAGNLMLDSLHDQVDGNVVLDFADIISNWRYDLMEFEQMSKDPAYTGPTDMTSFALAELYSNLLRAGNKITPGAPLFDSVSRSALIRGEDARSADPRKVFRHSSDPELDEWYKEHQVTENVQSYFEILDRKYSTGNWLYALANNARYGVFGDDDKTGFFWWEMPVRTMGDPLAYVWAGEFNVDYDNIPEGMSREQYDAEMACKVKNYIDQFANEGLNASEAVKNYGFMIPKPARKAALNYMYDQLAVLDQEWINRNASGELADKNEYQVAKGIYYQERDKINSLIYDWLKNDDIPEWGTEYEQLLTDYDITYVYKDTGKPVPASVFGTWVDQFDPNIEAVYKPKGNHPTSLLPWTEVDYSDNITNRGYNAETVPYWWREGMTGSDAEALRNLTLSDGTRLEDAIIPFGRDTGERLGDVLFGMQNSGAYSNPDEPTIGWRAYVPREMGLSDDILDIGKDYEEAWKETKNNITNAAWSGQSMYPARSYGSGYGGSGYSKSSSYNPKIYSFKAQGTHISNTHTSPAHTNPNQRSINADRAATMYAKQPQSGKTNTYLRPSFSTKGSREAYKRQDI